MGSSVGSAVGWNVSVGATVGLDVSVGAEDSVGLADSVGVPVGVTEGIIVGAQVALLLLDLPLVDLLIPLVLVAPS